MPPQNPDWVKALKPSGPQGSELLAQERANSELNVDQLANFLFTKEVLERNARLLEILSSNPVFDKSQNYFRGRRDRLEAALARAKTLRQLCVKHKWTRDEYEAANELISEPTPYGLHASMFLKTLEEQGTPEQHKLFLEPAQRYEFIGCYAQTELGHGSNVRGLETTATWDAKDKTFILHSPHLTASKWWIGSLGKAANHAVVVAQLILNGKSYGPHPFVVQIRDLKTHMPLPNIHVGDIGPKFGYNTMDNGFLLFNHVKIPHINMLGRFSRVDPETGKYVRPSNPALVYGTMTFIRSGIVLKSGSVLARGVTIATRYCAVRRQFQDYDAADGGSDESQVLNYTMVQYRILPLLAASYALHFTGRAMIDLYQANQRQMAREQDKRGAGPREPSASSGLLADLHAISCSLKAFASTTAAEGLEVCRRACGGHGYSAFSGIGSWYADYLPTVTWEGDNYMLTQQVARYLLKAARAVLAGNGTGNDITRVLQDFLGKNDAGAAFDVLEDDQGLVDAFAWRVAYMTFETLKHRDEDKQSWNSLQIDFWRLSTAFAQYQVVKNFYQALRDDRTRSELDPATLPVLRSLFQLFALHHLTNHASEFATSAAATMSQTQLARTKHTPALLEQIRPHAVRLVDVWKFPDWQLDSSLGRYDGKVYEDMFHRASEVNPMNDVVFDPIDPAGQQPNSLRLLDKFSTFRTSYKFVDGQPIHAFFVVPNELPSGPRPLLVRFHGGAVEGEAEASLRPFLLELALKHGSVIVTPDYRLRPEHEAADGVDDIKSFWKWIEEGAAQRALNTLLPHVTIDPGNLMTAGESWGGYLIAVTALLGLTSLPIKVLFMQYLTLNVSGIVNSRGSKEEMHQAWIWNEKVPYSEVEDHLNSVQKGKVCTRAPFGSRVRLLLGLIQAGKYWEEEKDGSRLCPTSVLDRARKLPPILLSHSKEDEALPWQHTNEWAAKFRKLQPDVSLYLTYQKGEHVFDKNDTLSTPWLKEPLEFVRKYWPA